MIPRRFTSRFNRVKGSAQSTRLSYSIPRRGGATSQFDLSVNPTLVKPTCLSRIHTHTYIYIVRAENSGRPKSGSKKGWRRRGRRWGKKGGRGGKKKRGGVSRSSEFSRAREGGTIKLFLKYSHITGRWYANIPVPGLCRPCHASPPNNESPLATVFPHRPDRPRRPSPPHTRFRTWWYVCIPSR